MATKIDEPAPMAANAFSGPQALLQLDKGLLCLSMVASHFRIASDVGQMAHELGLGGRAASPADIVRAAQRLGLKSRWR